MSASSVRVSASDVGWIIPGVFALGGVVTFAYVLLTVMQVHGLRFPSVTLGIAGCMAACLWASYFCWARITGVVVCEMQGDRLVVYRQPLGRRQELSLKGLGALRLHYAAGFKGGLRYGVVAAREGQDVQLCPAILSSQDEAETLIRELSIMLGRRSR